MEVVDICNRSLESSQPAADELDIPKACAGWTDVIADPDIDAVVFGTWLNMHGALPSPCWK